MNVMVTIRKPEDANGGGEPTGPPSDIFDNLAALRLEPDAAALVGAVEILAHVLIRRPSPTVPTGSPAAAKRATDAPWDHNPPPYSLVVPTSLPPCCVQVPPLRVNTHAAPTGPTTGDRSRSALLGPGPPTIAVLPSADSATDMPWLVLPTAPVPTSFGRCSKDRTRSAFAAARPFGSTESPACHAKYLS